MNHRHFGPPNRACSGCLVEANEQFQEIRRQRFWRGVLFAFLFAALVGALTLFWLFILEYGRY